MTNISDTLAALKPCPFCGSKYSFRIIDNPNGRTKIVQCGNCCAEGPVPHVSLCEHTEASAIAAWNTRTGQLVPVPSVERVARLRQAAVLLLNHAEGCAVNHYGEDFAAHGMPGWLADCRADIEAATAVIAAMQEGRDG